MEGPNAALAYATLDFIKANPEEWNQEVWLCLTAGCFAGNALLLDGLKRPPTPEDLDAARAAQGLADVHNGLWFPTRTKDGYRPATTVVFDGENRPRDVREEAIKRFNISRDDANYLFSPRNTLEDLEEAVLEIFGPRPEAQP